MVVAIGHFQIAQSFDKYNEAKRALWTKELGLHKRDLKFDGLLMKVVTSLTPTSWSQVRGTAWSPQQLHQAPTMLWNAFEGDSTPHWTALTTALSIRSLKHCRMQTIPWTLQSSPHIDCKFPTGPMSLESFVTSSIKVKSTVHRNDNSAKV